MLSYLANVKRKILIASFLKPVNDIRSYQKIAKSLATHENYDVYCVGYPSNIELSDKNVMLLPLSSFKKNGFERIMARWQVFKTYLKLKPELIIVNSPDLLIFTMLYKILFGGIIIYDIRENYYRNLWYQQNYRWGLKHVLAILVRVKELITAPLFDHFFLAEKVYSTQLSFTKNKFTIIENKSLETKSRISNKLNTNAPSFIISGTIAYEYGIFEGINFFRNIEKYHPKSSLVIIGHCPNKLIQKELEYIEKSNPSIRLNISSNPIPHSAIEKEIMKAEIGLLPYLPNKSTKGKWPTKLYEYMGYQLPFIIQKNMVSSEFINSSNAGIEFDFTQQSLDTCQAAWEQISSALFYQNNPSPNIYWSSEKEKLIAAVQLILTENTKSTFRFI